MDRSGLAALNGDILRRRGHIAVHRDLRYQVGAGEQPFLDLPVFPGGDSLIDFIPQNVRAGNIERKNEQTYSDDGCTQVATMTVGVAAKADAIVPNPVLLRPYRTFQEVEQPVSQFVFRIGDRGTPEFKLVEAEGGIWKTEAVRKIKDYLELVLSEQDMELRNRITIIG